MTTQQDVIKKFMTFLDTTTKQGEAALDAALAACSNFTSYEKFLAQLLSDVDAAGSAENFLKTYCGIDFDNEDTGAITGSDAGGSVTKTAESIVPESGTLKNFTGNSFTANGLTVKLGEVNSSGATVDRDFSDLSEHEIYLWQAIYTWWMTSSLDLIAESYGDNYSFTEKSSAVTKTLYIVFANEGAGALAATWGGPGYAQKCTNDIKLHINLYYYGNATGENGAVSNQEHLDRTIAHELTHAVMRANIDYFDYLPAFIKEGMAEITHGVDDVRATAIKKLAGSSTLLRKALVLSTSNVSVSGVTSPSYAGGYIFLRYLAHQASDAAGTEIVDEENLTFTNADKSSVTISAAVKTVDASKRTTAIKITGNAFANTITGGSGNDTLDGAAGNDVLTGGNGADVFIWSAGNDTVTDYGNGADKISLGSSLESFAADEDVILATGDGSLTIVDGVDKKITLVSGGKTNVNVFTADGIFNAAKTAVTLNSSATEFTADSKVVSIDAGLTDDVTLRGNIKANRISFGDGEDVFIWQKGDGNDTLENFGDDDLISVTGAQVLDGSVASGNVYLKVGTNKITVKDSSQVTFDDGDTKIFSDGIFYDADKTSATLGTSIKDFNATGVISVTGNDKANKLTATSDATLTGGKGNDTFVHGGGDLTIADYGVGSDKISLSSSVESFAANEDVTISTGDGSLTIVDGVDKKITLVSGGKSNVNVFTADGIFNSGKTAVTLNSSATEFTADSKVVSIDAGLTDGVNLRGNTKANRISFGDGEDIFIWSKGDGNDTLENFSDDDLISVTGAEVVDGSVASGNTYLKIGTNKITVKDSSQVSFTDGDTKIFSDGIFYDADKTSATLGTSIKDFTATGNVVNVTGNDKANKLTATNDATLTGGKGNDTFVHGGGDLTITDYGVGSDKISLGSSLESFAADEDVILATGDGSLTIVDGVDKKITLVSGGKSNVNVFTADGIFNAASTAVTLNSSATEFTADSKVVSIDAGLTDGVNLRGNSKANKISLSGGTDVFIWSKGDGNDTLENFSDDDLISVTGTEVVDGSIASGNTYLKIGTNKITVKDSSQVTFDDGDTKIFSDGIFYDAEKTSATLGASIKDFTATGNVIDVTGNTKANKIYANDTGTTLNGGKGNDSLWGGAGVDTFVYTAGTGNDTICGYESGELLSILGKDGNAGSFTRATFASNKLTLAISGGGNVIFSGVTDATNFNINNTAYSVNNKTLTKD